MSFLESEQEDLLVLLVEASRAVSGADRESFFFAEHMGGSVLQHKGLPQGMVQGIMRRDLDALARSGFITATQTGSQDFELDVLPAGFQYFATLNQESADAVSRVETSVERYLNSGFFKESFPQAHSKWMEAEELLWTSDTAPALTTIGHLCREAIQFFATELVERCQPPGTSDDPAQTVARVRAVLDLKQHRVGAKRSAFLVALLTYWGTVIDLVQRQEHGAQKEGESLTWEDARRVIFQTAIVMFEIARAVR